MTWGGGQGTVSASIFFHFQQRFTLLLQALASAGGGTCCNMLWLVLELAAAGLCSWIWLAMPPYSEPARGSFYLSTEAMSWGPSGCSCWTFLSGIDWKALYCHVTVILCLGVRTYIIVYTVYIYIILYLISAAENNIIFSILRSAISEWRQDGPCLAKKNLRKRWRRRF